MPPLGWAAPVASSIISGRVSMREKGMNSNTMRVPCSRASPHSCANSSMSFDMGAGVLKKSPTLMCRAPSAAALSSSMRRVTSEALRFSPSVNQSMRNSSSRCLMP